VREVDLGALTAAEVARCHDLEDNDDELQRSECVLMDPGFLRDGQQQLAYIARLCWSRHGRLGD
jgi:hypothetical protein